MMDDTARLNHLDREQESQDGDSSVTERLDRWLAMVIQRGASDLLLVSGAPPCMRVNGEVRKIEPGLLDGPEIEAAVIPRCRATRCSNIARRRSPTHPIASLALDGFASISIASKAAPPPRSAFCPRACLSSRNSVFRHRWSSSHTCPADSS